MDRLLPPDLPPAADLRVETRPDGTAVGRPEEAGEPAADEPVGRHEARLRFTGTGAEYARLWYLHTLLTLLTLGIYSAWAKVRRQRWFAHNTDLLGSRFDFDADPRRILAGRLLAVLLLVAYTHAFDITPQVGLAVFAALAVAAPLLMRSAHRFQLRHTRWRGVRFGFDAALHQAASVVGPPALLMLGASAWAVLDPRSSAWTLVPALLAWPWMHARMTAWRQSGTRFGDRRFDCRPLTPDFYRLHAGAVGWGVVAVVGAALLAFAVRGVEALWYLLFGSVGRFDPTWWPILSGLLGIGFAWICVVPYLEARAQRLQWRHTRLGPVRFRCEIDADALRPLILRHYGLSVLTLGLWWPFAAVAIARYRIESLVLVSDDPLDLAAQASAAPGRPASVGDGAADVFDLDIGW